MTVLFQVQTTDRRPHLPSPKVQVQLHVEYDLGIAPMEWSRLTDTEQVMRVQHFLAKDVYLHPERYEIYHDETLTLLHRDIQPVLGPNGETHAEVYVLTMAGGHIVTREVIQAATETLRVRYHGTTDRRGIRTRHQRVGADVHDTEEKVDRVQPTTTRILYRIVKGLDGLVVGLREFWDVATQTEPSPAQRSRPTPCPRAGTEACRGHCLHEILARSLIGSNATYYRKKFGDDIPTKTMDKWMNVVTEFFVMQHGKSSMCDGLTTEEAELWCCRDLTTKGIRNSLLCFADGELMWKAIQQSKRSRDQPRHTNRNQYPPIAYMIADGHAYDLCGPEVGHRLRKLRSRLLEGNFGVDTVSTSTDEADDDQEYEENDEERAMDTATTDRANPKPTRVNRVTWLLRSPPAPGAASQQVRSSGGPSVGSYPTLHHNPNRPNTAETTPVPPTEDGPVTMDLCNALEDMAMEYDQEEDTIEEEAIDTKDKEIDEEKEKEKETEVGNRSSFSWPLITQNTRFWCFEFHPRGPLPNGATGEFDPAVPMDHSHRLLLERLRPGYWAQDPANLPRIYATTKPRPMFYHICTNQQSLNGILAWALKFGGFDVSEVVQWKNQHATMFRYNNVVWWACSTFETKERLLHLQLCPNEPYRMQSVTSHALGWMDSFLRTTTTTKSQWADCASLCNREVEAWLRTASTKTNSDTDGSPDSETVQLPHPTTTSTTTTSLDHLPPHPPRLTRANWNAPYGDPRWFGLHPHFHWQPQFPLAPPHTSNPTWCHTGLVRITVDRVIQWFHPPSLNPEDENANDATNYQWVDGIHFRLQQAGCAQPEYAPTVLWQELRHQDVDDQGQPLWTQLWWDGLLAEIHDRLRRDFEVVGTETALWTSSQWDGRRASGERHPYDTGDSVTFCVPVEPPRVRIRIEAQYVPETLPYADRFRLDLHRSYAGCLLQILVGSTQGLDPDATYEDIRDQRLNRIDFIPVLSYLDRFEPVDDIRRFFQPDCSQSRLPVGLYRIRMEDVSQPPIQPPPSDDPSRTVFVPSADDVRYSVLHHQRRLLGAQIPPTGGEQVFGHRMTEFLLREHIVQPEQIEAVLFPKHKEAKQQLLHRALYEFVRFAYHFEGFQDNGLSKSLVNHFVGACQGSTGWTSESHYRKEEDYDEHLLALVDLYDKYSDSVITRTNQRVCLGTDTVVRWLEITVRRRVEQPVHFGLIYSYVLEEQCMEMYQLLKKLHPYPETLAWSDPRQYPVASPSSETTSQSIPLSRMLPMHPSVVTHALLHNRQPNWLIQQLYDCVEVVRYLVHPDALKDFLPAGNDTDHDNDPPKTPSDLWRTGKLLTWKTEAPKRARDHRRYVSARAHVLAGTSTVRLPHTPATTSQSASAHHQPSTTTTDPSITSQPTNLYRTWWDHLAYELALFRQRELWRYPHQRNDPEYDEVQQWVDRYIHTQCENWEWKRRWNWPWNPTIANARLIALQTNRPTRFAPLDCCTRKIEWTADHSVPHLDPLNEERPECQTALGEWMRYLFRRPGTIHTESEYVSFGTQHPSLRPPVLASPDGFDWSLFENPTSYAGLYIQGAAGTGKTTFVRKVVHHLSHTLGLRVVTAAPTHIAGRHLYPGTKTLHRLFGLNPFDASTNGTTYRGDGKHLLPQEDSARMYRWLLQNGYKLTTQWATLFVDVLIVDEISMLSLDLWLCLYLFHRARPRVQIVLLGDPNQLPPVKDATLTALYHRNRIHPEPYPLSVPIPTSTLTSHTDVDFIKERLRVHQAAVREWQTYIAPSEENTTYVEHTPIVFDLIYDDVHHIPGLWLQLRGQRRGDRDSSPIHALLQSSYPLDYLRRDRDLPHTLALPPPGGRGPDALSVTSPVLCLKAVCFSNHVRMAVNWRIGCWYRALHPEAIRIPCRLRSVFDASRPNPSDGSMLVGLAAMEDRYQRYLHDIGWHHTYLQDFEYCVGMEVYCRKNRRYLSEALPAGAPPDALELVNARKAVIRGYNESERRVTLRWWDAIPGVTPDWDTYLHLSLLDFAFHFVPGFCVTAYMAQGDTFLEDYVVLEWDQMDVRTQYVAVTRAGRRGMSMDDEDDESQDPHDNGSGYARPYIWLPRYIRGQPSGGPTMWDPWDIRRFHSGPEDPPTLDGYLDPSLHAEHRLWMEPKGMQWMSALFYGMFDYQGPNQIRDGCPTLSAGEWFEANEGTVTGHGRQCSMCASSLDLDDAESQWNVRWTRCPPSSSTSTRGDESEDVETTDLRTTWSLYTSPLHWLCDACAARWNGV